MFQVIERYAPDLSVRDDDGHTPAIVAADNGHVRLTHYIQDQDAIEVAKVTNPIPPSCTTLEFNLVHSGSGKNGFPRCPVLGILVSPIQDVGE